MAKAKRKLLRKQRKQLKEKNKLTLIPVNSGSALHPDSSSRGVLFNRRLMRH